MAILFEENKLRFDQLLLPEAGSRNIQVYMARLDLLHPVVSGNKLFKLHYYLQEAIESNKNIVTYGGAYSNHLAATAYAARSCGINAKGIVRGERPHVLSHTLQFCMEQGMMLEFISRQAYADVTTPEVIQPAHGDSIVIPEGGSGIAGVKGAALIMNKLTEIQPTHVCVAAGTGTTAAGLANGAKNVNIIAFPVLKDDIAKRLSLLTGNTNRITIEEGYHFGGYAKKTKELLYFMNQFYKQHKIPLDFVYTAKMMAGVVDMLSKNKFPEGSIVVCLHTGGLQGNQSLKNDELVY